MRFFFAPLLVLTSCLAILDAKTGPGTDYPCGVGGVSCGGHECCPQYNVCGGTAFSGCPAGQCCFTGEGEHTDAGAPSTPQRPE
jgi:hypothetical protein